MKCPKCGHVILTKEAERELKYMRIAASKRGGFIYEGARPAYEDGSYHDDVLDELLSVGAIVPHPDPTKGWIIK